MNVSETGNLSRAYRVFGWVGGTIYEVASQLGMPGRGCELAFKVGEYGGLAARTARQLRFLRSSSRRRGSRRP